MQKEAAALDYWVLQKQTRLLFQLYNAEFSACQNAEHRWLALLLALSKNSSQVHSHLKNIDVATGNLTNEQLPTQNAVVLQKKAVLLPSRLPLFPHRIGFGIPDVTLALTGTLAGGICMLTPHKEIPLAVRPLINSTHYILNQLTSEITMYEKILKQHVFLNILLAPTIMAAQRKTLAVLLETEEILKAAPSYLHALIEYLEKIKVPHDAQTMRKNSSEYIRARYIN